MKAESELIDIFPSLNCLGIVELTAQEEVAAIGGDAEHLKRYLWVIPGALLGIALGRIGLKKLATSLIKSVLMQQYNTSITEAQRLLESDLDLTQCEREIGLEVIASDFKKDISNETSRVVNVMNERFGTLSSLMGGSLTSAATLLGVALYNRNH